MKYAFVLGTAVLAISLLPACDQSPAEVQADAKKAQNRADEQIDRARRNVAEEVTEAQAKANAEAQRARDVFVKSRDELRQDTQRKLDVLSVKLDELNLQMGKETGKRKADLESMQKDIIARRVSVERDLKALETTTVDELETIKARLTAELGELTKALDKATLKI